LVGADGKGWCGHGGAAGVSWASGGFAALGLVAVRLEAPPGATRLPLPRGRLRPQQDGTLADEWSPSQDSLSQCVLRDPVLLLL